MMSCLVVFALILALHCIACHGISSPNVQRFLQSELASVGAAQQKMMSFLQQRDINIGQQPSIHSLKTASLNNDIRSRIVMSTEDNNIECRIALGKAPIGAKCVAPCGCTGTQKWIQFSEFNRLRRNDPAQWVMCPTCQQKFIVDEFTAFGGLKANLIGLALDNLPVVRTLSLVIAGLLSMALSVDKYILRFLTSHAFWKTWTMWSWLARLPFMFQVMAGRVALQWLTERYLALEKSTLLARLIEWETESIEEGLPVGTEEGRTGGAA